MTRSRHADNLLSTVAGRNGATVQQIALAWPLARSPNIVFAGTSFLAHLDENVASVQLQLTTDDVAQLET